MLVVNDIKQGFFLPRKAKFEPNKIGRLMANGGEGDIYEYDDDKVIKFAYEDELIYHNYGSFLTMMKTLKGKRKYVAYVYDYGSFTYSGYKILYYTCEKLRPIPWKRWTPKVNKFKKEVAKYLQRNNLDFLDFAPRNIVVDSLGNFKLIDHTSFRPLKKGERALSYV